MSGSNPFEIELDKNPANYAPLTPLGFIERAAYVYPARTAVVHGKRRYTWAETYTRCRRLASALAKRAIGAGDVVAVMLSNTPEMVECHFGVPMTGAVLNTLNTRLDAEAIAFMLEHGGAKILITDREFSETVEKALASLKSKPQVIDVDDPEYRGGGKRIGSEEYERFLASGDPAYEWTPPADEWSAISLNYTSGTTGNPKGVVYHHRGAYLNAICNIVTWRCRITRCTCGRCPCSTATAGASPGPWPPTREPMCACAGSTRPRCSPRCASTAWRIIAARP